MEKILILIGLHFVADFSLQNDFQAKFKSSNKYIMLAHCVIWTTTIYLGLMFIGASHLWKWFFLISGHYLIDTWKCERKDKSKALTIDLYTDQVLHILQILAVFFL